MKRLRPGAIVSVFAAAVFAITMGGTSAQAQGASPSALLRSHAEAGTLADAEKIVAAQVTSNPANAEARAALGFARFARAVERLGQSLHRHGLRPPPNMGMMLPVLRFPVPENANPEALDYQKMRAIYVRLLADLAEVDTALASIPAGEFKLKLDLFAVRLDIDGDGKGAPNESLGAIIRDLSQPGSRRGRGGPGTQAAPQDAPMPSWNVAFDRADTIWLRGYARLLSAFSEFALAHDWRDAFNTTAQLFFPKVEGGTGVATLSRRIRPWAASKAARLQI